jgi:hypothetical protein
MNGKEKIESGKSKIESERQNTVTAKKEERREGNKIGNKRQNN